jgi:ATP/maltotriose-dependent transcriptional regulator MalT
VWWQGYPDQALERGREIAAYSQQSTHPFEKCWAMMILGTVQIFRREPSDENGAMAIAVQLAHEHEFSLFKAWMPCFHAALLTLQGRPSEAISAIAAQLPAIKTSGNQLHLTLIFAFLADAHLKQAEVDDGLAAADEGLRIAEENAESYNAGELHRLRGELLQIQGPSATAEAEKEFLLALEVTHKQEARALELRAAMSLARLWQSQGSTKKGYEMLAPIYGWFTEGLDTKDLRQAAALLHELQQA